MFDLASTMAPAALMRATWNASLFDTKPASASEPLALCRPMVSKLSFTIVGTQCSGPVRPPCANRRSRSSACFSASGLVMTMALMAGPFLSNTSMRRRYCSTSAAAGQLPGLQRRVDLRDGGFVHLKRRWGLGRRRKNGDGGEKDGEEADEHGGMILNTPEPTQMTLIQYSRAADDTDDADDLQMPQDPGRRKREAASHAEPRRAARETAQAPRSRA